MVSRAASSASCTATVIDLSDFSLEALALQSHGIRSECIRLDHPRSTRDVLLMNSADPVGIAHAQLLETTLQRHTALQQDRADCAIAADDARLKLLEQIHPRWD